MHLEESSLGAGGPGDGNECAPVVGKDAAKSCRTRTGAMHNGRLIKDSIQQGPSQHRHTSADASDHQEPVGWSMQKRFDGIEGILKREE